MFYKLMTRLTVITQFPCSNSVALQGDVVSFVSRKSNECRTQCEPLYILSGLESSGTRIYQKFRCHVISSRKSEWLIVLTGIFDSICFMWEKQLAWWNDALCVQQVHSGCEAIYQYRLQRVSCHGLNLWKARMTHLPASISHCIC